MSNLPPISITHTFNGDSAAEDFVDASQLDTQLGNLAAEDNAIKAVIDLITDGNNNLATQSVGKAQMKPDVVVALDDWSLAVLQKTLLQSCACVATANIVLSGLQTIDGHLNISGERVLVMAQSTASQNGIYLALAGAWTKVAGLTYPSVVFIDNGTLYQSSMWSIDSTLLVWIRVSSSYVAQLSAHIAATGTAVHGLGNASTKNVGTTAGTVAAGDDSRMTNARTPVAHEASHLSGASDPLVGILDANARVEVDVAGVLQGTRRKINLIAGNNVTLSAADNAGQERVDVTLAATIAAAGDMLSTSINAAVNKTGNSALTATDANKWLVLIDATAQTIQLPLANTVPAGGKVAVYELGVGMVFTAPISSLNIQGTDTISGYASSSTSIKLVPGNFVILESDGSGQWLLRVYNFNSAWSVGIVNTFGSTGTPPTKGTGITRDIVRWRRVGQSIDIAFSYQHTVAGAAGTGNYILTGPTGVTLDYANGEAGVSGSPPTATYIAAARAAGFLTDGTNYGPVGLVAQTSGCNFLVVGLYNVATYQLFGAGNWPMSGAAVGFNLNAQFKVAGW